MTKNKLVKEINQLFAALATEEPAYRNYYITKKDLEDMNELISIMHELKENYFTHENAKPLYLEVCHYYIKKNKQPKRETKIKIRKAITFARTLFLLICVSFIGMTIASVNGDSIAFPIICFGIAMVCFGISYGLDCLLFETAWSGDRPSPFTR